MRTMAQISRMCLGRRTSTGDWLIASMSAPRSEPDPRLGFTSSNRYSSRSPGSQGIKQLQATPALEPQLRWRQERARAPKSGSAQQRLGCVLRTPRATRMTLECTAARDRPGKTDPPASAQSVLCSSQPPQDRCEEKNLEKLKTVGLPAAVHSACTLKQVTSFLRGLPFSV